MQGMAKFERDYETNKQISIMCIVVLVIIMIVMIFLSIILLFSKVESSKKIDSIKSQIETINYENGELEDEIEINNELIYVASNSDIYADNLKDEYKSLLPPIEEEVKKTGATNKIAYLNIILSKDTYLDKVLNILNRNEIISNFYSSDPTYFDEITEEGHLVGLFLDDINSLDTFYKDNKDIIDIYNIDLYMVDASLSEEVIDIPNLKQVKENSTSEEKKQLTQSAYVDNILKTTADRSFLIIKLDADNPTATDALPSIIDGLKEKGYLFLPLISSSSIFD